MTYQFEHFFNVQSHVTEKMSLFLSDLLGEGAYEPHPIDFEANFADNDEPVSRRKRLEEF